MKLQYGDQLRLDLWLLPFNALQLARGFYLQPRANVLGIGARYYLIGSFAAGGGTRRANRLSEDRPNSLE